MALDLDLYVGGVNIDHDAGGVTGTGEKLVTDDGATLNDVTLTGETVVPTGSKITITDAPASGTDAVNKDYVDSVAAGADVPRWYKYTLAYDDFSGASLTDAQELFELPARAIISGIKVKSSTQFAGPSLSAANIRVGISAKPAKLSKAYDLFASVAATHMRATNGAWTFDDSSVTSIVASLTTVGCNVEDLTGGEFDVWVMWAIPEAP